MQTARLVLCVTGAIIGAGFASGREIMTFFSGFGSFSWALVGLAVSAMTLLICKTMRCGAGGMRCLLPAGRLQTISAALLFLLLLASAGGMTAAAGELVALTVPVRYARGMGMALSLVLCLLALRRPLRLMEGLGRLLIPLLTVAFILCRGVAPVEAKAAETTLAPWDYARGVLLALAYAGMNVMLAAGILCEAGAHCVTRGRCRGAAWCGLALGGLLCLGNAALLPHAQALRTAALPTVMLLRAFGKPGYYLAAGALYLAVVTTLLAVLRALYLIVEKSIRRLCRTLLFIMTLATSLLGFEDIVAIAYPFLGLLCFGLLMIAGKGHSSRNKS